MTDVQRELHSATHAPDSTTEHGSHSPRGPTMARQAAMKAIVQDA